jgi:hypothetical protein
MSVEAAAEEIYEGLVRKEVRRGEGGGAGGGEGE